MERWAQHLERLIRDERPRSRKHTRQLARDAAAHVPNATLAALLEKPFAETLDMIAVADDYGYGDSARQHALAFVAQIAYAESVATAFAPRFLPTGTPSRKSS
jgi:hypothetical protein